MSAQSKFPDAGEVLFQDEHKVISLHAGSSPRAADFAFTSISNLRAALSTTANGVLTQHVLRALDVDASDVPMPVTLGEGFSVRRTPAGVVVVFVVTVAHELNTALLLHRNLLQALLALRAALAGKAVWLPLMGTGAGGLTMEASLQITLGILLAGAQAHSGGIAASPALETWEALLGAGVAGRPSRFCIDLPLNLGPARREKLRRYAHQLLATRDSAYRGEPSHHPVVEALAELPAARSRRSRRARSHRGVLEALAELPAARVETITPMQPRAQASPATDTALAGAPGESELIALLLELFDDGGLREWVYLALGKEVPRHCRERRWPSTPCASSS